jgi:hypothetical protein
MEFARLDFSGDFICEFHKPACPKMDNVRRRATTIRTTPVIDHPRHTSERY